MLLMALRPGPPQPPPAGVSPALARAFGYLGISSVPEGTNPIDHFWNSLEPVGRLADPELTALLSLKDDRAFQMAREAFSKKGNPSRGFLKIINKEAGAIRGFLLGRQGRLPEELAAEAAQAGQALEKIVEGAPSPVGAQLALSAAVERQPLEYLGLSPEARVRFERNFREVFERLVTDHYEHPGDEGPATPKALSLEELLKNPEPYQGPDGLVVGLAKFDIDGTTHSKEPFIPWGGQYTAEWLIRDIVRYGPQNAAGVGWSRFPRVAYGYALGLIQEFLSQNGYADSERSKRTIREGIIGLDSRSAEASMDRFRAAQKGRAISRFMLSEFAHHRRVVATDRKGQLRSLRLMIGLSAGHRYLARRHAEQDLGVPPKNVFGTTIELDEQKRATGEHYWAHGKSKNALCEEEVKRLLREKGINFVDVASYSDSGSDQEMHKDTLSDGGIVFAVNPRQERYKQWVLDNGGFVIEERNGWLRPGKITVTYGSSAGSPQRTRLSAERETSPVRPQLALDLWSGGVRTFMDATAFAAAAPVSAAVTDWISRGDVRWSLDLLRSSPSMAAGGAIGSALTAYLTPDQGPVSASRRIFVRGAVPLTMATMFAGQTAQGGAVNMIGALAAGAAGWWLSGSILQGAPDEGAVPWYRRALRKILPVGIAAGTTVLTHGLMGGLANVVGTWLVLGVTASTAVEAATLGERLTGLRTTDGEEVKNPWRRWVGSMSLRSLQAMSVPLFVKIAEMGSIGLAKLGQWLNISP